MKYEKSIPCAGFNRFLMFCSNVYIPTTCIIYLTTCSIINLSTYLVQYKPGMTLLGVNSSSASFCSQIISCLFLDVGSWSLTLWNQSGMPFLRSTVSSHSYQPVINLMIATS